MDKKTAEKLYDACYMRVYSYVMTLVKDQEKAQEITQDTFFKAMTAKKSFRGESECYTWLCAIAKNLFIDETRRRKKLTDLPEDETADTGGDFREKLEDKTSSLEIHRILHEMEEPYKEVFSLRVFGELSFKQIGTIFHKTETWARVTYHRARLKIQERMA